MYLVVYKSKFWSVLIYFHTLCIPAVMALAHLHICAGSPQPSLLCHKSKSRGPSRIIWASTGENLSSGFANKEAADKPAHPRSLISTLIVCLLESIISKLASNEILIF